METWIYSNTYSDNQLVLERMKENVEVAIRRLASHLDHNYPMNYVDQLAISNIRESVNNKSKKEQAFDIIVAKCVDMYRLSVADNVVSYNKWVEFDEYMLTEEEFNLIKEVEKNE
jgi:hypothetical protein